MHKKDNEIVGCLLGSATGDALGLPMEGISRRRQQRMFPSIDGYHLLFGKGMVSDDTEHACMVAQALITSGGDEHLFGRDLAWRLRKWLCCLPAGVGFATLKAILKLCVGFPYDKSGVFSAGNGPAMRCAVIGVCFGEKQAVMKNLVTISTRITHRDPKAVYGSLAVALAAFMASRREENPSEYLRSLKDVIGPGGQEFLLLVEKAVSSATQGHSTEAFASTLGLQGGVSGYIYHTVPVVLHAWFRHPRDFRSALIEVIRCGGDTDTTASILGGIVGAGVGKEGIPQELISGLWDWPINPGWIVRLGSRLGSVLSGVGPATAPKIPFAGSLIRNIFFLAVVLAHGFRRLLPPY